MSNAMKTVITQYDVERSSTLTKRDIGKDAVIDNGCFYIRDSHEQACELARLLNE